MSDYATKTDLQRLEQKLDKRFDDLTTLMSEFANDVNNRFDKVESRLDKVELNIASLTASHDKLLNTIDTFIGRIDSYETEQAARDLQFERLLSWARKVSKQTGIPLDNL